MLLLVLGCGAKSPPPTEELSGTGTMVGGPLDTSPCYDACTERLEGRPWDEIEEACQTECASHTSTPCYDDCQERQLDNCQTTCTGPYDDCHWPCFWRLTMDEGVPTDRADAECSEQCAGIQP